MLFRSQSFIPTDFWVAYKDTLNVMLPSYEEEYSAIFRRDATAAWNVCVERAHVMAAVLIRELVGRGVLADDEPFAVPSEQPG